MIIRLSTSSGNWGMGYLNFAGLGCQRLSLQNLCSIRSSANSDRWKWVARKLVTSLASVLGGNCTKLVLWCFKFFSMCSHDLTHVLLSALPVDSISCEGFSRVASRLYCVVEWGCTRPWESEGGSMLCAGFCASSSIHTENFFFWDCDQHVKHCRYCRGSFSTQFWVWPLESKWCRGCPVIADLKSRREKVVSLTKAVKEGYTGALVWCRNCCIISCSWGCAPYDCPHLWCCWVGRRSICWGAK